MFIPRRGAALGCAALLALTTAAPRATAQYATAIAIRGDVAPDSGGSNFTGFGRPAINDFGQVAFYGTMPGTGSLGDQVAGVFATTQPLGTLPQVTGNVFNGQLGELGLFAGPVPTPGPTLPTPPALPPGRPALTQWILQPNGTLDPDAGTNDATIAVNQQFTHTLFYSNFSTQVAINNNLTGQVAFQGKTNTTRLSDGQLIPLNGIFTGTSPQPDNMRTAALVQTPAPNDVFPTAGNAYNAWIAMDRDPSLNNKGQMAFWGSLNNAAVGTNQGIFITDPALTTVRTVATTGVTVQVNYPLAAQAIPITFDTFEGPTSTLESRKPAINDNGSVAFYATTQNANAPAGIFRWDPAAANGVAGTLTAVALEGQPAPGTLGNYRTITPDVVTISNTAGGLVAFKASVDTGPGAGDSGIFAQPSAGAPAVNVALTRDNISGIVTRSNPNNLGVTTPYSVLYPNGLYPPNYPPFLANTAVHYVDFFSDIAQNADGQLVFGAGLAPGGGGGIFLARPNGNAYNVTAVALSGNPAPGAGAGVSYGSIRSSPLAVNDHLTTGQPIIGNTAVSPEIAFLASLTGNGVVTGQNDLGLFLANDEILPSQVGRPDNPHLTETVLLARTGQQLTVAPGLTLTIKDFGTDTNPGFYSSTGKGRNSINAFGQMTVLLDLTDPVTNNVTQGVFVFSPDLHLRPTVGDPRSPATPAGPNPIPWSQVDSTTITTPGRNDFFTFGFTPSDRIYKVVLDPGDAAPGVTDVTVGPVTERLAGQGTSVPALQVGGVTGRAHLLVANGINFTLGSGRLVSPQGNTTFQFNGDNGISNGSVVLTMQSGTNGVGFSSIDPVNPAGAATTLRLKGDVRVLAGATSTSISTILDLGNVPLPNIINPPPLPNPQVSNPSTADIDRFRTFNVDRGNFVGANPIDLVISGSITSAVETAQFNSPNGNALELYTNRIGRGLIKTGAGTLQLTGINTFGPNTATPTIDINYQVTNPNPGGTFTTTVTDPYVTGPFVQSIQVLGGELSVSSDANLGLSPGAVTPTNPYRVRWITLNGGALQSTSTFTIDPNRGIALGPVTGFGSGTFDVTAGNTLTYLGTVADNTDGVTTGVGTLIKNGLGTLVLGKANTYRGGTIVNAGTLIDPSVNDTGLGAVGTPVTVNAAGTLVYAVSATTQRPFTLNGGTLSVSTGNTLTFSAPAGGAPSVTGGRLTGPGAFDTVAGGGTALVGTTTAASATLTVRGSDVLTNVTNNGALTIASTAAAAAATDLTNTASGRMTVSGTVATTDFSSTGNLAVLPGGVVNNLTTDMILGGGSVTSLGVYNATTGQVTRGGTINLGDTNLYVSGGFLRNNGTINSNNGNIIVDAGATVRGAGVFNVNNIVLQNGGRFLIGNSPALGVLRNLPLASGSPFGVESSNATGIGGSGDPNGFSGWGVIEYGTTPTNGSVTITSNPSSKALFGIGTVTDTPPRSNSAQLTNFDPLQSYTWPVIRPLTVAGFNSVNGTGNATNYTDFTTVNTTAQITIMDSLTNQTFTGAQLSDLVPDPQNPQRMITRLNAYLAFDDSGWNWGTIPLNQRGTFDFTLLPDTFNTANRIIAVHYTPVPEPGTLLLVCGAAAAGLWWRRRAKASHDAGGVAAPRA